MSSEQSMEGCPKGGSYGPSGNSPASQSPLGRRDLLGRVRKGFYLFRLPWVGLLVSLGLALGGPAWGAEGYVHPELLMETGELAKLLKSPNVRLIDAVDPALYGRAHIPGAVNLFYQDLSQIEERKESGFPLSPQEAEKLFGAVGIDEKTQVIVYDGGEGPAASSVWYVLTLFGHKNVRLLNGGLRKWIKEGRPIIQELPKVERRRFTARPQPGLVVKADWLAKNLQNKALILLDARSFKEYIGEEIRGVARGGHIPGAVHLEWVKVGEKLETFKPADKLRQVFEGRGIPPGKELVVYCQSGTRATALLLALRLIGYDNGRLYAGSWQEWANDPAFPVEK
ncbi:MAG: sulfurtransferase [Chloroflexi bacterium]|nr:sulfurtransferase [Chloroflexota bacterium]